MKVSTEYDMAHNYLKTQWNNYKYANKERVNKIIKEELKRDKYRRFDKTLKIIKKRCQNEYNSLKR